MPVFHDSALIGAAGAAAAGGGGYAIERSLRFNSADSAYLSRTPASAGNRKTWTWAGWVKRSALGSTQALMSVEGNSDSTTAQFWFSSDDKFRFGVETADIFITNAVFRDCSAWYHFIFAFDATNATSADKMILYVNGVRQTTSTYTAPSNTDYGFNRASAVHSIGRRQNNADWYLNGYLGDVHLIDGQQLTPSSFGETDATTGVWMPKAFSGSYGTNGFRLDFADNSSAAALGYDAAGSNDWTLNNLSVTAGAGNDSLVDVPVNGSEVDTGVGGEVRGNYCTWNPLDIASGPTLSNGNLDFSYTSSLPRGCRATFAIPSSGKWYFETTMGGSSQNSIGVVDAKMNIAANPSTYCVLYDQSGFKNVNGSASSYGASFTSGDVIGIAVNSDTGQVTFYKNNSSQGALSLSTGVEYFPFMGGYNSTTSTNFGQRPFAYTAPSGFKALCTTNLPAPVVTKPSDLFDVTLYTGNSTDNRAITGLGFSPDLVWFGPRSQSGQDKVICDSVRGVQKALFSNQTYVEADPALYGSVGSFDANGFTIKKGTDATFGFHQVNLNSSTYAAWCWDAGSSTVTNNTGTITGAQVRANASAGTSVVAYTGNGTSGATVGHGLGVAPAFIIVKKRSAADDWVVYHSALGATKYLWLHATNAEQTGTNRWNDTAPTSTVFSLGSSSSVNGNASTFIAYCFAPVAGYSAFGSYTGNGSADGAFVYTGHRSRWIMIKRTDTTSNWTIIDTAREGYNVDNDPLFPNLSDAEGTTDLADILSNGFKLRSTDASVNASSGTYVYAAFSEAAFQYSRAR